MINILTLLFEGQTRKFTALNFLLGMGASSELKQNESPPIHETLSKMSFKIRVAGQPEPQEIVEVLMPLSNELQTEETEAKQEKKVDMSMLLESKKEDFESMKRSPLE